MDLGVVDGTCAVYPRILSPGEAVDRSTSPDASRCGAYRSDAGPGAPVDSVRGVGGERVASRVSEDVPVDGDDLAFRELMGMWDQNMREEARQLNGEILSIVQSMGGNTSRYRRERGRAVRAVLSEIYSPPRVSNVAKMCPAYGVLPGFALDLTTHDVDGRHWDFDEEELRNRAWAKVKSEQPLILIGTPMCTAFSAWQHINIERSREGCAGVQNGDGTPQLLLRAL